MATQSRLIFVNLAVADVAAAQEFFGALGFAFDPKFTTDECACMVVSDEAYVMLLVDPYFRTFTPRPICPPDHSEVLTAISVASRDDVLSDLDGDPGFYDYLEVPAEQTIDALSKGGKQKKKDESGVRWEDDSIRIGDSVRIEPKLRVQGDVLLWTSNEHSPPSPSRCTASHPRRTSTTSTPAVRCRRSSTSTRWTS